MATCRQPHVVVVGAGVGGLFSARQLLRAGARVTVLEASDKVGGKIRTTRAGGTSAELGAMRLLQLHSEALHLVRDLSLETRPFIMDCDQALFLLNGQRGCMADFTLSAFVNSGLVTAQQLALSGFNPSLKPIDVLVACLGPGAVPDSQLDLPLDSFLTHKLKSSQDVDNTYSNQHVACSNTEQKHAACTARDAARASLALIVLDVQLGAQGPHYGLATSREFQQMIRLRTHEAFAVVGGMDLIITRLLADIASFAGPTIVRTGCAVSRVIYRATSSSDRRVQLFYDRKEKNNEHSLSVFADAVILTGVALDKLTCEPALPDVCHQLKERVTDAYKMILRFRECFWVEEGIIGGASVTNQLVTQVIYPSGLSSGTSQGMLTIYEVGAVVSAKWRGMSRSQRVATCLDAIVLLHGERAKELFIDADEIFWDRVEDAPAYCLLPTDDIDAALTDYGSHTNDRVLFSSIPRGWVNETLLDVQKRLRAVSLSLGLQMRVDEINSDKCNHSNLASTPDARSDLQWNLPMMPSML